MTIMKKLMLIAMTVLLVIVVFSGCPSAPPKQQKGLPMFVVEPPMAEDALYGVGYGKFKDQSRSLEVAKARGRNDVARQIEVQVQGALTDYFQEAGADENTQSLTFIESVSREIVDQKLQGARTKEVAVMDDGGIWVLIEYSLTKFKADFEEVVDKFSRNEDAAFAEFKAQEALKFLDKKLEGSPTQAQPVTE
jgi:hypothetical protein